MSTAFRCHDGEMFLSTGFRVLQVGLLGVSVSTYLIDETA